MLKNLFKKQKLKLKLKFYKLKMWDKVLFTIYTLK